MLPPNPPAAAGLAGALPNPLPNRLDIVDELLFPSAPLKLKGAIFGFTQDAADAEEIQESAEAALAATSQGI